MSLRILLLLMFLSVARTAAQTEGFHQTESERHQFEPPAVKGDGGISLYEPLNPRPEVLIERTYYGYSPYWTNDQYLHFNLITHYACFSVGVNADGSLNNSHNFPQTWAWGISRAHRTGVKVILCATCFDGSTIHSILTTGAANAINNLLNIVRGAGVDGVNIDFEGVPGSDRGNLTSFMQRLVAAFRPYGLEVTIATPPVDWSNAFDYRAIADTTGGMFIMGYNYHYSGSAEAGPCAPLTGWGTYNIRWTVNDYLVKTNNNVAKIILGLPYYGYEWPTETGNAHSRTTGTGSATIFSDAVLRALARGERWDSESQTPWYAWYSSQWNQGWFDNELSLYLKYQDANANRLVGSGVWALAYDGAREELWAAIQSAFNSPQASFANGNCETWFVDTVAVPHQTSLIPADWCLGENTRWDRVNDYVHGGQYALRQHPDSLGRTWPVTSVVYQDVLVSPGSRYEFSGWGRKNDGVGNRIKLTIQWFNADRRMLSEASSAELSVDSTAYRYLTTGPVAAPAAARFARLRLSTTGYGYYDRWDDLGFVQLGGAEEAVEHRPSRMTFQASPNPFRNKIDIRCTIRNGGQRNESVTLLVYDPSGRLVKSFPPATLYPLLSTSVTWVGADNHGRALPAGTYFAVLKTADGVEAHPIVLIR